MNPAAYRKHFIKVFNGIAHHHRRLRVFEDFLELAALAIRKTTVLGEAADKIEAQYLELVGRHEKERYYGASPYSDIAAHRRRIAAPRG